jgi:hypothetical protein
VHRDLKPDNILVAQSKSGREVVKVVDFGIAKAMQEGAGEALTRTGLVIGTPEFMSPEQLLGDPVDARSDLYALGCILHLMLTASPAFEAPTREQMIKRRLSEDPPRVQEIDPGIPDSIDRIVSRLLARSPDERYGSAAEVRDSLTGTHTRRVSGDGTALPRMSTPRSAPTLVFGAAQPSAETPVAPPPRRRGRWLVAGLVVIGLAWGGLVLRNAQEQEAQRVLNAQRDSTRRAFVRDSAAKADSLLAVTSAVPMVDSVALLKKRQTDSLANVRSANIAGVTRAITSYTNAIQRGDMTAAHDAFPTMTEREQQYWQNYLNDNELKIVLERPRNIILSSRDSTADADIVLRVRYTNKSTKSTTTSPRLRRHAVLARQGTGWQLKELYAQ